MEERRSAYMPETVQIIHSDLLFLSAFIRVHLWLNLSFLEFQDSLLPENHLFEPFLRHFSE